MKGAHRFRRTIRVLSLKYLQKEITDSKPVSATPIRQQFFCSPSINSIYQPWRSWSWDGLGRGVSKERFPCLDFRPKLYWSGTWGSFSLKENLKIQLVSKPGHFKANFTLLIKKPRNCISHGINWAWQKTACRADCKRQEASLLFLYRSLLFPT